MKHDIQFDVLWRYAEEQFQGKANSFHGIDHWKRVSRNGRLLAGRTGADQVIVELFSLFHDCCRLTEDVDPGHGVRAAELAFRLRGELFDLPNDKFDLLHYACTWHQDRNFSNDVTVGTCWDADRLDLGRVGIVPDPGLLNTEMAKQLATQLDSEASLSELDTKQNKQAARHIDNTGSRSPQH